MTAGPQMHWRSRAVTGITPFFRQAEADDSIVTLPGSRMMDAHGPDLKSNP
jgi:hypothetical protein